jgi:hypothetical protein
MEPLCGRRRSLAQQAYGAVKAQSRVLDSDRLGAWKEILAVLSMSTARN